MRRIRFVATFALIGITGCSTTTNSVTESAPVQEAPKTYLTATGTWLNKYLDQDFKEEPARFVVALNGDGSVSEVRIGSDSGTHWNINSCKPSGEFAHLYQTTDDGEKDPRYAMVYESDYCHIGYRKDGRVGVITITKKQSEKDPETGFRNCPSSEECKRYTVNTEWVATTSTEPTPNEQQRYEIHNTQERLRDEQRQKDFDRKWAEGEVEDLKKACRMGQKHWTLCPDGYDKP